LGVQLFQSKGDVFNAILIVSLVALAAFQVHGLVQKNAGTAEPAAQPQYTVERLPEVRPEPPPPRTSGRSVVKVAQRTAN
jgi:hypothetical protein